MGLSDYKINSFSKPVSALDDTPKMSASELKEWFDSNSTNELKKSVNGIIDELKDVDINKQHTHDNKDILDAINEEPIYDTVSDGKLYARKDGAWSEFGDLPSISIDELDTFLDGVCIVKGDKYFVYDGEGTGEFISGSVYEIESECYALCIANCEYEGDHWWYSQVLLFANGETYTRCKEDYYCWDENDENYGTLVYSEWSAWKRIKAYSAYNADNAVKAQKDGKGNIISDTYIKNTDYATKDVAGVVKVNKDSGIKLADNKTLMIVAADEATIDKKTSTLRPITPHVLDYAVKSVTYDKTEITNTYATKEELADKFTWKLLGEATVTEANVTDAGEDGVTSIAIDCGDLYGYEELRFNLQCGVNEANAEITNANERAFFLSILKDINEVVAQTESSLVLDQGSTNVVLNHTYTNNLIINSYFTDGVVQYSELFNTNYNSHCYKTPSSVALPTHWYKLGGGNLYGCPLDLKKGHHIVVFQTRKFKFPAGTILTVYGR